jgi:hypothetical protein
MKYLVLDDGSELTKPLIKQRFGLWGHPFKRHLSRGKDFIKNPVLTCRM